MDRLPLTRRHLLGGGLLLAGGWVTAQLVGHRPLPAADSPFLGSAHHTLASAFEALLPAEADAPALAAGVDDFLAAGDPVLGGQLRMALTVLEHAGGAGVLHSRRFSRQSVDRRREVLEAWRRSTLAPKRQIADALRRVALFTWYSHPDAWASIGYDGPWVGR